MRRGFADDCIAATSDTAARNVTQFLAQELPEPQSRDVTIRTFEAALKIASDLAYLCAEHHAERRLGHRRW
jgi:hypothetical protein